MHHIYCVKKLAINVSESAKSGYFRDAGPAEGVGGRSGVSGLCSSDI